MEYGGQLKTLLKQLEAETGGNVIIITILDICIAFQQFHHINNHHPLLGKILYLVLPRSPGSPRYTTLTLNWLKRMKHILIKKPLADLAYQVSIRVLLKLENLLIGRVQTQCFFEGDAGAHGVNNDHDYDALPDAKDQGGLGEGQV